MSVCANVLGGHYHDANRAFALLSSGFLALVLPPGTAGGARFVTEREQTDFLGENPVPSWGGGVPMALAR
jgi:hypothetical protein